MAIYGEYNPDGTIKTEANECIVSSRPVDALNSIRERITGTPFFYRVLIARYPLVTDAQRSEWRAAVAKPAKPAPVAGKKAEE